MYRPSHYYCYFMSSQKRLHELSLSSFFSYSRMHFLSVFYLISVSSCLFMHSAAIPWRDTVHSTAIHYGLDGPRIENRWERHFPYPSGPTPIPTQTPVQFVQRRPSCDAGQPSPSSAAVANGLELYMTPLCACVGSSWGPFHIYSHTFHRTLAMAKQLSRQSFYVIYLYVHTFIHENSYDLDRSG